MPAKTCTIGGPGTTAPRWGHAKKFSRFPRGTTAGFTPKEHSMNSLYRKTEMKSRTAASALTVLTLVALFVAVAIPAQAQTVTTLYNFGGVNGDPTYTAGNMAQGRDGNFYGVSQAG